MSNPTTVATVESHVALAAMVRDLAQITDLVESEGGNSDAFVMDLMDQILRADSFDEIFAAQESGMTSGKDFADIPFIIERPQDVEWRRSSDANIAQGGFPFYSIMKVTTVGDDNPRQVTLNCGGKTFVAVLYKLWTKGWFDNPDEPKPLMIRSVATTDTNAYLQLIPARVIAMPPKTAKKSKP